MKASRSAATLSGRSQLGLWPVAGYTTTLALVIATASCCSSSRGNHRSHSPQTPRTAPAPGPAGRAPRAATPTPPCCRPAIPGRRSAPAGRHARDEPRPRTGHQSTTRVAHHRQAERRSLLHSGLGIVDPRTAGKAHGGKPKLRYPLLLHGRPSGTPTLHRAAYPTAARAKHTRDAVGFLPWRSPTTPERAVLRLIWVWLAATGPG
jgi:hypothetical protein